MPPVTPNPAAIRAFKNEAAFERWLKANHQRQPELFLRIYKKASGKPTITYSQALDVALCWGWIDGIRKSYDAESFLQRFTPRTSKSRWSQVNQGNVARLIKAGRMTEFGQRQIDAAKADGRWAAAYAPPSQLEVPLDLLAAIQAEPKANTLYQTLNRQNLHALAYRMTQVTAEQARQAKIRDFVAMLKRGETPHPNAPRRPKTVKQATAVKAKAAKKTPPR